MSTNDELRGILDQTARDVARLSTNPRTWLSWMTYMLRSLEQLATNENPANKDSFKEMLSALQDEIKNRLRTGGW